MFLLPKQERLEHVRFGVERLGDLQRGPLESVKWSDHIGERGQADSYRWWRRELRGLSRWPCDHSVSQK